jgi:hypothetical protein
VKRRKAPPLRFILATTCGLVVVSVVCAAFGLGPKPLFYGLLILYAAYFIYGVITKDHTIWLWLLFGLVTGAVEVVSNCDHYLVEDVKTLFYPDNFPKIGVSPAYLPIAWGLIFTVLGLTGEWVRQRKSLFVASVITALFGSALISMFENLARPAGWWYYRDTPMLISAPYFVNIFEFLSTLIIAPVGWGIARESIKSAYGSAIASGVLMGLWMCAAMRIGWWLMGPCSGAVIQLPCFPVSLPPVWHQ